MKVREGESQKRGRIKKKTQPKMIKGDGATGEESLWICRIPSALSFGTKSHTDTLTAR